MFRALVTSALVFAGGALLAPKVLAESVPVPFTGVVPGSCVFKTVTGGQVGDAGFALVTPAFGPAGASGQVEIDCTGPGSLTVGYPIQTGGPNLSGMRDSQVNLSGLIVRPTDPPTPIPFGMGVYPVDMLADNNGSPLEPGAYSFEVNLTITPF